jgi:hypothetical protein
VDLTKPGFSRGSFQRGEVLVHRRIRDRRVMHAMPVRVVSDRPELTVLYSAPDTAFKSARTADGGKVHDFSDWVLTDVVWAGGSFLRLITPGAWHAVDVEFDADGRFDGWYVNFQTPAVRGPHGFDIDDLVIDLVVTSDHAWHVKDAADFERAVADNHISAAAAARVRTELAEVIGRVARWEPPFADQAWPAWRPPASWLSAPALPPGWNAL